VVEGLLREREKKNSSRDGEPKGFLRGKGKNKGNKKLRSALAEGEGQVKVPWQLCQEKETQWGVKNCVPSERGGGRIKLGG